MDPEVLEYAKAKESIKRLRDNPKIIKWIKEEGKRKLDEHIRERSKQVMEQFKCLTQDDIDWLIDENQPKHPGRILHILYDEDDKSDDDNHVYTGVLRGTDYSPIIPQGKKFHVYQSISQITLFPVSYWNEGYDSLL
jgi:hypothetical protein